MSEEGEVFVEINFHVDEITRSSFKTSNMLSL